MESAKKEVVVTDDVQVLFDLYRNSHLHQLGSFCTRGGHKMPLHGGAR